MDRKLRTYGKRILSLLAAFLLLCPTAASAFAQEPAGSETILDPAALTELTESFLRERGIPTERVGIGLACPASGEQWYYNGDTWFYPGSIYKLPLMMVLAERVSAGMLAPDTEIEGWPLSKIQEYVLTYSNNDWAHVVRTYLEGDEVWREEAKQYAALAEDDYDPDYMAYGYVSPRYITGVLSTLYADPERFPNVTECLLQAQLGHYFRLDGVNEPYAVAQKYGSYCDDLGNNWNGNAGILYTPHPIILTVMTRNVPDYEWVIAHFALLFKDYALSLEEKFPAAEQAEEERKAEEEEALLEEERLAGEKAEAERLEEERLAAGKAEAEQPEAEKTGRSSGLLLIGAAGLLALLAALLCVLAARVRKRRRYESYRRRFEEELRQESARRRDEN